MRPERDDTETFGAGYGKISLIIIQAHRQKPHQFPMADNILFEILGV
jgi:hypothetical protein